MIKIIESEDDKQRRAKACKAEHDRVLKEYDCRVEFTMSIHSCAAPQWHLHFVTNKPKGPN